MAIGEAALLGERATVYGGGAAASNTRNNLLSLGSRNQYPKAQRNLEDDLRKLKALLWPVWPC
jgi:hypothetical protein